MYVYVYIYMNVYVYTYIYIYECMYMYIYICIYTCIYAENASRTHPTLSEVFEGTEVKNHHKMEALNRS